MGLRSAFAALLFTIGVAAQHGGELRFAIRADPKTFNPLLVAYGRMAG